MMLGSEYLDRQHKFGPGQQCKKCAGRISMKSRGQGSEPYCERCGFQQGKRS